jgi:hypothetical protein
MTELEALLRARHRKLWHDRGCAEAKSKRRVTPKGQGPVASDVQRVCARSDPMPGKGRDDHADEPQPELEPDHDDVGERQRR